MPLSAVTRVELNQDDTISLMVTVYGFEKGTPIEISGQVIQDNGAVGTFYSVQEMPADEGKQATLTVTPISAVAPKVFVEQFPITVIARAAEVWITKLDDDTSVGALRPVMPFMSHSSSGQLKGAWALKSYGSAVSAQAQEAEPGQSAAQLAPIQSATPLTHHGTWWDRNKTDRLDLVMEGRFTRLFPYLPAARFNQDDLVQLADQMI